MKNNFERVLAILGNDKLEGRAIRQALNEGIKRWQFWNYWSGPATYQLLARMEDAGLVTRHIEYKNVAGQRVKVYKFRATERGCAM